MRSSAGVGMSSSAYGGNSGNGYHKQQWRNVKNGVAAKCWHKRRGISGSIKRSNSVWHRSAGGSMAVK